MQSDMKEKSQIDTSTDEELIDVLIAISVVLKASQQTKTTKYEKGGKTK